MSSTHQTPFFPSYQVAGRDLLDSVWHHNGEEAHVEEANRTSHQRIVMNKPLARSVSFESAPSPTPPRLPTIDVTDARVAPAPTPKLSLVNPTHETDLQEASTQSVGKKRQRYLRDVDRHRIIQRIDNGEKQADLAREYGVTRAAICHIKKNRAEIASRCDALLASAKELERIQPTMNQVASAVHELTQPSVQLLLTALRDVTTSPWTFRSAANRLMILLLEEAMTSAQTVSTSVCTTTGQTIRGLKATTRRLCCVGVGEKGWPLVELYRQIEPCGSVGSVDLMTTSNGPVVDCLDLPRGMPADASILLVTISSGTGESVCASVWALQRVGVALEDILIVVMVCTSGTVDRVKSQFPGIRILTCAIEPSTPRAPPETTLCDFLDRYDATKRKVSLEKRMS